ncbi:MAG: hypothetical protein HOV81_05735 [Kofleriaceae bacterium]|nr:hypothetical protein [Kofleriaceae bacterium]
MTRSSRFRIEVIELDDTENETRPFARAFTSDDDKTDLRVLAAVAQRLATSELDITELPRSRAPRSTASGTAPLEIEDEITTIIAKR